MVNYQNAKIYKIINETNEIIYIGSTAEEKLCKRFNSHKLKAPNHKIILIENYACNSKDELRKREQEVIEENNNLLNKQRAYISEAVKKTNMIKYNQKYRENNKPQILQKQKEYRENNIDKIHQYNNEKITCEFCYCKISKCNLKRHQKTNKKCLVIQEN